MIFEPQIDFLTIRLNPWYFNKSFYWIVLNSPIHYLNEFIFIEYDNFYWTHTYYNIFDVNRNKLAQICIINENNKKNDVYNKITFYWTFFNLYYYNDNDFYDDIIKFFWIKFELNKITRIDLKQDFNNFNVFDFQYKIEYIEKVKTFGTSWKSLEMNKEYKFRVYNKLLDILDKWLYNIEDINGYKKYFDLLQWFKTLTRLELQINSRLIKIKNITLNDLQNTNKLSKIFTNYYISVFYTWLKKTRDNQNKIDYKTQIKYFDKIYNSKTMAKAYIKKLYMLDPANFRKNMYEIFNETAILKDNSFIFENFINDLWNSNIHKKIK